MMGEVAESEAKEGVKLKIKIMEVGYRTLKRTFQRSNPTATPGCIDPECIERGKGGNCWRNNVNYEIECHLCADGGRPVYRVIYVTLTNVFWEYLKNW